MPRKLAGVAPTLTDQQHPDFLKDFLSKLHGRAAPDRRVMARKNLSRGLWHREFLNAIV
jgi:hypothetical protein